MPDSVLPLPVSPTMPSDLSSQDKPPVSGSVLDYLNLDYLEKVLGIDISGLLTVVLGICLTVIGTLLLAKIVDIVLARRAKKKTMVGGVELRMDETFQSIVRRLLVVAIYLVGMILVIFQVPALHEFAIAILAGAGVAGIAIGFAAQDSLSNLISGIFMAIFKPIRVGDYVDFDGTFGRIEDLTLRHTVIKTWDEKRIVVPNSVMNTEAIVNWTLSDPAVVWAVEIGIGYGADIDKAREIIIREATRNPIVRKDRDITVRVTDLGEYAVNLRLIFTAIKAEKAFVAGCEIREAVKKGFDEEGIEIPYPYRNLIVQKPGEYPASKDERGQAYVELYAPSGAQSDSRA
jgi:small conductance mechanosensitive channel